MTVEDISRNHEKINVYMSEAISELYNRNCIDQRIILGLGNKLNELYASQIELKQMLGAFVTCYVPKKRIYFRSIKIEIIYRRPT